MPDVAASRSALPGVPPAVVIVAMPDVAASRSTHAHRVMTRNIVAMPDVAASRAGARDQADRAASHLHNAVSSFKLSADLAIANPLCRSTPAKAEVLLSFHEAGLGKLALYYRSFCGLLM